MEESGVAIPQNGLPRPTTALSSGTAWSPPARGPAEPLLHPIPVPDSQAAVTLPELLDNYAARYTRGYGATERCNGTPCDRCPPTQPACTCGRDTCHACFAGHDYQPVEGECRVWPPPAVCVVPLNRTYTVAGEAAKRHTAVHVPDGAFPVSRLFEEPRAERSPTTVFYRCLAAGYHIGDTPRYGHYVALVRGSNGYVVANDANVQRGAAVESRLRFNGRGAACTVAFVVLERVDDAVAGRTPKELANNLTARVVQGWTCGDHDCLHSNPAHATVCGGCAHWDGRTLNWPLTTRLWLPLAACPSLPALAASACLSLPLAASLGG